MLTRWRSPKTYAAVPVAGWRSLSISSISARSSQMREVAGAPAGAGRDFAP